MVKLYIDFNTDKRKNAANSLEKKIKLVNYNVYGKTLHNFRKRINVRLINNAKGYQKYVSKPSFVSQKKCSKNFVTIHETKPILTLNKPIYAGLSILGLSKLLMYDFHYGYIKRNYDAKLLFTDTGSLVYEIETEDIYEDFYEGKNLFGFTNYPEDSIELYSKFFDFFRKIYW